MEGAKQNFVFAPGIFAQTTWDERKRLLNIDKHGIDFKDAVAALTEPHLEMSSNRHGEIRTLAVCRQTKRLISVVYTFRGDVLRIISARAVRKNEQRAFEDLFG
ncbi:BrnT family toxin [Rhizobium sp. FKL33]|uniref:BrnT family toxin n=1 Tax=Rhizobium sp. FKL33 TaxID=2562307 RepID=UPI001FEEB214|nr:BrnT family toxin [Rhizobium sp. FKL33]